MNDCFFFHVCPMEFGANKNVVFFGRGHQLYRGNFNLKCFKDPILQTFLKSWVDLPSQVTCMQCYIYIYIHTRLFAACCTGKTSSTFRIVSNTHQIHLRAVLQLKHSNTSTVVFHGHQACQIMMHHRLLLFV